MSREHQEFAVVLIYKRTGNPTGYIDNIFTSRESLAQWVQDVREKGAYESFTFKRVDLNSKEAEDFKSGNLPSPDLLRAAIEAPKPSPSK